MIFVAINSSYSHSNLAVRYLSKISNIPFLEFNINMPIHNITQSLMNYDYVFFSCYIWNIEYILKISNTLKQANPHVKIIFGGPQVSFTPNDYINYCDYIMCGEGEEIILPFIDALKNNRQINIDGIIYKQNDTVFGNYKYNTVSDINNLPFAYDKMSKHKIVYFESSRGCPYSCAYCISGNMGNKVRYMDIKTIRKHLSYFANMEAKVVKFIDRTFNANKTRAKEILKTILDLNLDMCFHFEIGADLLDDETIEIFNTAPKGMFQLEAGIQSFNEKTLKAVERNSDINKIYNNLKKLNGNTHTHIDLIAGLPYENLESFKNSFNKAYNLKKDMLQLGFLKILPGSRLEQYNIKYNNYSPFEVISTPDISYKELLLLKKVEFCLDKYYNSGHFKNSLNYLETKFNNPFDMFYHISKYFETTINVSSKTCIDILYNCYKDDILLNLLKYDFLLSKAKGNIPECFNKIRIDYKQSKIKKQYEICEVFDIIHINPITLENSKTIITPTKLIKYEE